MFANLDLHERLLKVLAELQFNEPTPVQSAAIPLALAGRDLRVTARTGSGKTAAFVLPLLHRLLESPRQGSDVRVLILLPTRELALQTLKEVERFAAYTFLKAALITGGANFKEQAALLRKMPEILIGTPGRLMEHLEAGTLVLSDVELLVLDEADRMLDMGFADAVSYLADSCIARQQTWLFSATTGGNALREITGRLLNNPEHLYLNPVTELAPDITQQIITADGPAHKEQQVFWLLNNEPYRQAIIFTNTRAQADRLYGHLVAEGCKAFVLHGEKTQDERRLIFERLRQGGVKVLVATDVAARGLDIEGLDLVINFDMPRSGTEYVHRIGRTGRQGQSGTAISLICAHDWNLMSSIERYLKQHFERRVLPGLKGHYKGPKQVKASGKAAGTKKKKSSSTAKAASKKLARPRKPVRESDSRPGLVSADGMAPLKRRSKD